MDYVWINEINIRLGVFFGLLGLFLLAEYLLPRRKRAVSLISRWRTNFSFTIFNTVTLRIMEPITAIVLAGIAVDSGIGLFNKLDWPYWVEFILALLILDLAIYVQHVVTHKVPVLWRLHKVHHADRDIDTTTALRFHPIEISLSMFYKVLLVIVLGPAVLAVLVFEIILNGCAMFNHSNLKLPIGFDRLLRPLIVTPDMHRVHHSVRADETNSNYGFSLSIWDRLFRTYKAQPKDGHDNMTIGLSEYQSENPTKFFWSLFVPFRSVLEFCLIIGLFYGTFIFLVEY